MSLNELSAKVGVSNGNLSKWKTGKVSAVRFFTPEAICEALNCQPRGYSGIQKSTIQNAALSPNSETMHFVFYILHSLKYSLLFFA